MPFKLLQAKSPPLLQVLEKYLLQFDEFFKICAKFVRVHQRNHQKAAFKSIMTNKGMPLLPRGFQGKINY